MADRKLERSVKLKAAKNALKVCVKIFSVGPRHYCVIQLFSITASFNNFEAVL